MLAYRFDVLAPAPVDIMMYTQLLVNSMKSPQSIKNYISGAKSFISQRGGNVYAFFHPTVVSLLKGFTRRSLYVPTQAPAIQFNFITQACTWLRAMSVEGEIIAGAVMFAITTFLRQSHFVFTRNGRPHLIPRSDLFFYPDRLVVVMRASKTTNASQQKHIIVMKNPATGVCPVYMIRQAMLLVPAPEEAPIFLDPYSYRVISPVRMLELFKIALAAAGHKQWASVTLHSLRRSGPHACIEAGSSVDEIRDHGGWRSNAVKTYLPPTPAAGTPALLQKVLASQVDTSCLGVCQPAQK